MAVKPSAAPYVSASRLPSRLNTMPWTFGPAVASVDSSRRVAVSNTLIAVWSLSEVTSASCAPFGLNPTLGGRIRLSDPVFVSHTRLPVSRSVAVTV